MPETAGKKPGKTRVISWVVVLLTLLIWGGGISLITYHLRKVIRRQILQVYSEVLYAATIKESDSSDAEIASLLSPEDRELMSLLEASKAKQGVFAVRLYNDNGVAVNQFGPAGSEAPLTAAEVAKLRKQIPFAEYRLVDLAQFTGGGGAATHQDASYPVLRVLTPIRNTDYTGSAEFILDGENVSVAFLEVDRDLFRWALVIFSVGGAGIALALGWAFSRLQKTNSLLTHRTESLVRANHELALAAKTSAVGAITAHLIHDLKSPLFGLQTFVSSRASAAEGTDDEDWSLAMNSTRRMQKMIGDIVKILQEEKTVSKYELSIEEWAAMLRAKIENQARESGLSVTARVSCDAILTNKDANILLLVATNILHNAIQATPSGGTLAISASMDGDALAIDLSDSGPGLPDSILATLFTPSRPSKSGGTGLGLAISKQLANHIGADLQLKSTSTTGTIFQLRVPEKILANRSELALP
jgi:signal transduction histidine kinase